MTDAEHDGAGRRVKADVQDAWDFADARPEPPLDALYEDVWWTSNRKADTPAIAHGGASRIVTL